MVLLDGSLKAPEHFIFQETIIRGDMSEPIIGLASIAAKVTRDRKMIRLSKMYPSFDFHIHKGYGTLVHRQKIKQFGPCDIHRRSFLTKMNFSG
jgi:ribonuclease HII